MLSMSNGLYGEGTFLTDNPMLYESKVPKSQNSVAGFLWAKDYNPAIRRTHLGEAAQGHQAASPRIYPVPEKRVVG